MRPLNLGIAAAVLAIAGARQEGWHTDAPESSPFPTDFDPSWSTRPRQYVPPHGTMSNRQKLALEKALRRQARKGGPDEG